MLQKLRCWLGKHTFPLYAKKFMSIDPWAPEDGGYGYQAVCFVCRRAKEEWIYDSTHDYITPPNQRYDTMKREYEKLPELKLTEELKPTEG